MVHFKPLSELHWGRYGLWFQIHKSSRQFYIGTTNKNKHFSAWEMRISLALKVLIDYVSKWFVLYWELTDEMIDWLSVWLIENNRSIDRLIIRLIDKMIEWSIDLVVDWLIEWFILQVVPRFRPGEEDGRIYNVCD